MRRDRAPETGPRAGARSRKRLATAAEATAYQREWFAALRERVAAGEPLALVNADAPQEILRAMDIPYVVAQWWASVCSAKQRAPHYLGLLRDRGYPDYSEQYSAIPLGSALADHADDGDEPDGGPWGGLPPVSFVIAEMTGDVQRKIGEAWARELGAAFLPLDKPAVTEPPGPWWDRMPTDWEHIVGSDRLDAMVEELRGLIRYLETATGKVFNQSRFARVMELVNEQEEYNRRARDLLADAVPAPVDIADSIPAVMVPQWHRGTEWGRDAARRFYEEVADLVRRGEALCPDERVRLLWIGRGLWFNLGFYQHFQERYGAVFVWSMYLGIAADGYQRYGDDPLRALAARFAAFSEQLGAPGWADPWYVKEARLHGADGVVNLVASDARSSYFVTRALEDAGIPVLEIDANNADARGWDEAAFTARIGEFIETRAEPVAARRRARLSARSGRLSDAPLVAPSGSARRRRAAPPG